MRQHFGLGLAVLVGAILGAAAVTGLHAQAKPPVYLVSEIEVTNPAAYGAEFAPQAQAAIKAAGGRLIVDVRAKSPGIDSRTGQISEAGGEKNLAETCHQIGGPQMRVALQHSQFFVPADGAHLGDIEPALE